jgi:hypothetical protein
MLMFLHYFQQSSTVFIYLACFLISEGTFKEQHPFLKKSGEIADVAKTTPFGILYLEGFPFSDILHIA